jgi:hypothetical protein
MLDTLMKIGAYRVEHFESEFQADPFAFGFYIRGEVTTTDAYSRDAKTQLYAGLMLIHSKLQMKHLRGIYLDMDYLENLQRPAYVQLKADLINGLFKRVFVLDESALLGTLEAEKDLHKIYLTVGGFELLVCREGECIPLPLFEKNLS